MFMVRECVQECGALKRVVRETLFETIKDARSCLKHSYDKVFAQQDEGPGVWSWCLRGVRYTIDNNDGDFFDGCIVEVRS